MSPPRLGADRAEAREAIAACAMELLREEGEMAVAVRNIAERLGITAGTIYNYFESKDELLMVLADRALWALNARVEKMVGEGMGAEALRKMAVACIGFAREHPREFRLATSRWTGGKWVPLSEAADVFFARLNRALRELGDGGAGAAHGTLAVGIAALLQGLPLVAAGPAGWDEADDEAVVHGTLDAFLFGATGPR